MRHATSQRTHPRNGADLRIPDIVIKEILVVLKNPSEFEM